MKTKSKIEKKHYEVLITGWSTVLVVSAESEEKALEYATNECSFGDFQMDEAKIERVVDEDGLDNARRNADCVNVRQPEENCYSAPSAPSAPVAADPDDEEDPGEDIDNFPTARRTVPTSNHA